LKVFIEFFIDIFRLKDCKLKDKKSKDKFLFQQASVLPKQKSQFQEIEKFSQVGIEIRIKQKMKELLSKNLIDGRCDDRVDKGRIEEDFISLNLFSNVTPNQDRRCFRLLHVAVLQLSARVVLNCMCCRDVDGGIAEEDLTSGRVDLGPTCERCFDSDTDLDFIGHLHVESRILGGGINWAGDGLCEGFDSDVLASVNARVPSLNSQLRLHRELGKGPRDRSSVCSGEEDA